MIGRKIDFDNRQHSVRNSNPTDATCWLTSVVIDRVIRSTTRGSKREALAWRIDASAAGTGSSSTKVTLSRGPCRLQKPSGLQLLMSPQSQHPPDVRISFTRCVSCLLRLSKKHCEQTTQLVSFSQSKQRNAIPPFPHVVWQITSSDSRTNTAWSEYPLVPNK